MAKDPIFFNGGDTDLYSYVGNDPVNFIDPDGRLVLQLINAGVGAALGAYNASQNNGLFSDIVRGALIGGLTNAVTGRETTNAIINIVGNLASQVADPCFDGINYTQAIAAGAVGASDLGRFLPQPNLLSNTSVAAHAAAKQFTSQTIINRL